MSKYPLCKLCNEPCVDTFCEPYKTKIHELGICFGCVFWTDYKEQIKNPTHFVVNGSHYTVCEETDAPTRIRGFGGRKAKINFTDGRPDVITTNLWHQGDIPQHFISDFPDTAIIEWL